MKFSVLTLYPEYIDSYKNTGIIARAISENLINIDAINIRDYSLDKHRRVDDAPYGGGAGMVMQVQPVYDAIKDIKGDKNISVVYFSPKGEVFNSSLAKEFAKEDEIILLCGHYEGIDQRALDLCVTREISIGDYVLTGGHIAATVFIDSVSRYINGVLGNEESSIHESFENNLLEHEQYTRPMEYMGMKVPEVLLNGNHKEIEKYRLERSLEITKKNRPDLLK